MRELSREDNLPVPKIKPLAGLRVIACLAVFLCHCGISYGSALGDISVSLFFMLSGFFLFYKKSAPLSVKDACARGLKLYPLHAIMSLLCLLLYLLEQNYGFLIARLFSAAVMIQSLVPIKKIFISLNGPAWFLSTILWSYILIALFRIKRSGSRRYAQMILIICICGEFFIDLMMALISETFGLSEIPLLQHFILWGTYISPFSRIFDILIGGGIAILYTERKANNRLIIRAGGLWSVAEIICLSIMSLLVVNSEYAVEWIRHSALYVIPNASFIFLICHGCGIISKALSSDLFVWLGGLTGEFFLIHFFVLNVSAKCFEGVALAHCMAGVITLFLSFAVNSISKKIRKTY